MNTEKIKAATAALADDSIVRPFCALSTAHISQHTAKMLDDALGPEPERPIEGLVGYPHGCFGWLISVLNIDPSGMPSDLSRVMQYAHDLGCDMLLLDRDADQTDDLPTWDW